MKKTLWIAPAFLLLVPAAAIALDYGDVSDQYSDAPFSAEEAAGISLLTNVGAVEGNPDGTFAPDAPLNRAAFLKIALKSLPEDRQLPTDDAPRRCFADVPSDAWFRPFVCAAKKADIVQGYPDHFFHPERNVTYAEAVKILVGLYGYDLSAAKGAEWYVPYVSAAQSHDVLLPDDTAQYADPLARGQMARLAAAFLAESQDELEQYRLAEEGSGTALSDQSGDSSASGTTPAQASSSASSYHRLDLPPHSHIIMLGERTPPLAQIPYTATDEAQRLRAVKVNLNQAGDGIDALLLLDGSGVEIGPLTMKTYDLNHKTWEATFDASGAYVLPHDQRKAFTIEITHKLPAFGGKTEVMERVTKIYLTWEGVVSGRTFIYPDQSDTRSYPKHQTGLARLTAIRSVLKPTDAIVPGDGRLLGAFLFSGKALPEASLQIRGLGFSVAKTESVSVSNWQLGAVGLHDRLPCSIDTDAKIVSCQLIPPEWGAVTGTGKILQLYGDLSIDERANNPSLQVSLSSPGSLSKHGAVWWSDGFADFQWLDLPSPLAKGPLLK